MNFIRRSTVATQKEHSNTSTNTNKTKAGKEKINKQRLEYLCRPMTGVQTK